MIGDLGRVSHLAVLIRPCPHVAKQQCRATMARRGRQPHTGPPMAQLLAVVLAASWLAAANAGGSTPPLPLGVATFQSPQPQQSSNTAGVNVGHSFDNAWLAYMKRLGVNGAKTHSARGRGCYPRFYCFQEPSRSSASCVILDLTYTHLTVSPDSLEARRPSSQLINHLPPACRCSHLRRERRRHARSRKRKLRQGSAREPRFQRRGRSDCAIPAPQPDRAQSRDCVLLDQPAQLGNLRSGP